MTDDNAQYETKLLAKTQQAPSASPLDILPHLCTPSSTSTFTPDTLHASFAADAYEMNNYTHSNDMAAANAVRNTTTPFYKPMQAMPRESEPLNGMNETFTLHPMFGAPPAMPLGQESLRNGCDKTAAPLQGSQLGGTAWLGLGGPEPSIAGEQGSGTELNILSEFLEALDDPKMERNDTLSVPYKPEPTAGISGMVQRTQSSDLLNTPPSMIDLGSEGTSLGTDGSALPLLSPQHTAYHSGAPAHECKRTATEPLGDGNPPMFSTAPQRDRDSDRQQAPYPASLSKTATKTERFLLTAADQTDGSRDERLRQVIQAKCEAGLLRPYNHVNGYARLNRWMELNVSPSSRRRILKPLSVFRPVFYSIAKNLTNFDLIYIEEAFERLLLDYDRVFSIQGTPACLWRRTGEIYKGNKEFAELVGVPIESLREGRLCIYELMAEESAVNYWEKYGSVSFDPSQKAVLTMCKLHTKNEQLVTASMDGEPPNDAAKETRDVDTRTETTKPTESVKPTEPRKQASCISCCFSFTIRRDKYNIPTMIVGNFLPTHPIQGKGAM